LNETKSEIQGSDKDGQSLPFGVIQPRPKGKVQKYYARDQRSYTGPMKFSVFNTAPERATFPVLGFKGKASHFGAHSYRTTGSK
jgi:hypothetical protein